MTTWYSRWITCLGSLLQRGEEAMECLGSTRMCMEIENVSQFLLMYSLLGIIHGVVSFLSSSQSQRLITDMTRNFGYLYIMTLFPSLNIHIWELIGSTILDNISYFTFILLTSLSVIAENSFLQIVERIPMSLK